MQKDQFEEWDNFYAAWERTLTANGAMQSYKHQRNKERYKKAAQKAAKKRIANRAKDDWVLALEVIMPSSAETDTSHQSPRKSE